MLYLLDSNILLYSKMDALPDHQDVSTWLAKVLSEKGVAVMLTETAILSFLRISTNSKVFSPPLPIKEAKKFLSDLLSHPRVSIYSPTVEHYSELADLMEKHSFSGNDTMDAHLAVTALVIGATLVTRDADFRKIPYLPTLDPTKN
jgi:uncharacterized protein